MALEGAATHTLYGLTEGASMTALARRDYRRPAIILHAIAFSLMLCIGVAFKGGAVRQAESTDETDRQTNTTDTETSCPRYGVLIAWGAGGHYWAVYFVALLAGYSKDEAWKIAFLAWLPDQVCELDAAWLFTRSTPSEAYFIPQSWEREKQYYPDVVGKERWQNYRGVTLMQIPMNAADDFNLNLPFLRSISPRDYWRMIHRGLHSLTGGGAAVETEYRLKNSQEAAQSAASRVSTGSHSLLFGLSIHPLGDSFAHRNTNETDLRRQKMYPTGIGHAIEAVSRDTLNLNPDWFIKRGVGIIDLDLPELKAHAPDHVDFRPDLTELYIMTLYRLFRTTSGVREPRVPTRLFSRWTETISIGPYSLKVTPDDQGAYYASLYATKVLANSPDDDEVGMATFEFANSLWGNGIMRPVATSAIFPSNVGYDPHNEAIPWRDFVGVNAGAKEFGPTGLKVNDLEDLLTGIQRWVKNHP